MSKRAGKGPRPVNNSSQDNLCGLNMPRFKGIDTFAVEATLKNGLP